MMGFALRTVITAIGLWLATQWVTGVSVDSVGTLILAGLLLGVVTTVSIARAIDWPLQPTLASVVLAVGTSAAIGLCFGFLPAQRAAKMDPIEALRVE